MMPMNLQVFAAVNYCWFDNRSTSYVDRAEAKANLEEVLGALERRSPSALRRDRLSLLLCRLSRPGPSLSPRALFGLNYSGLLGAAATLATYIIVLLQFRLSG